MDVTHRRLAHALTGRHVHSASRALPTPGDNKPAGVTATASAPIPASSPVGTSPKGATDTLRRSQPSSLKTPPNPWLPGA